jgi:hypothetical protein
MPPPITKVCNFQSIVDTRRAISNAFGLPIRYAKGMASTHGHPLGPHGHMKPRDYSQTPLNVYWEVTRACDLACRHCRASAMSTADPEELTFDEGRRLLQQIREFGDPSPQLILTGGDPLKRSDLYDLMDEARTLGIEVSITPPAPSLEKSSSNSKLTVQVVSASAWMVRRQSGTTPFAASRVPSTAPWRPSASQVNSSSRFR